MLCWVKTLPWVFVGGCTGNHWVQLPQEEPVTGVGSRHRRRWICKGWKTFQEAVASAMRSPPGAGLSWMKDCAGVGRACALSSSDFLHKQIKVQCGRLGWARGGCATPLGSTGHWVCSRGEVTAGTQHGPLTEAAVPAAS